MKIWSKVNIMILAVGLLTETLVPLSKAETHSSNALYSLGSSGDPVQDVQSRLAYIGYFKAKPTGFFWWTTYWAVKDFQQAFGLRTDGIVGPQTMTALEKATPNWRESAAMGNGQTMPPPAKTSTTSVPSMSAPTPVGSPSAATFAAPAVSTDFGGFSSNDINLMSHVVYGEARNQPFEGEVAIAAVILNRYHSSKFPHSIAGIIYQPGAFTSVSNGQAWLGTNSTTNAAVMDAIHGWDPTHGALYYWNPATATSNWVWGQPVLIQIGNHVFAK